MPEQKKPLLIGLYKGKSIVGVQLSFQTLVNELSKRNFKFRIVNLGSNYEARRVGSFSVIRSLEIIGAIFRVWVYLPFSNLVYLTVSLSLLGFLRDLLILLPAFFLNKRTIIHVHSGGYGEFYDRQKPLIQKLIKFTIGNVNTIIVLSESLINQFSFLKDISKVVVVHNMVDPLLLNIEPIDKNFELDHPIQLLYLSNLMVEKGYLELLEACRILKAKGQVDFQCYFCGEFIQTAADPQNHWADPEKQKSSFLSKISQYGLDNSVKYLGVVSGETKKKVLQSSHLFILPTRYPWEGQPVSILEAMVNGLPVISTNYRAIPDLVQDGRNGFLLDSSDPAVIASLITQLWENPQKYNEMSDQARKMFWTMYSPEVRTQKMIQLLYK